CPQHVGELGDGPPVIVGGEGDVAADAGPGPDAVLVSDTAGDVPGAGSDRRVQCGLHGGDVGTGAPGGAACRERARGDTEDRGPAPHASIVPGSMRSAYTSLCCRTPSRLGADVHRERRENEDQRRTVRASCVCPRGFDVPPSILVPWAQQRIRIYDLRSVLIGLSVFSMAEAVAALQRWPRE